MALFSLILPVPTVFAPLALNTATTATTTDGAVDAIAQASVLVEPTGFGLVLDKIEYFILLPMVYLSILFMIAGIVYRMAAIMRSPATPFSLKIYPSKPQAAGNAWSDTFLMPQIRRRKPFFWISLMLFHIAGLLLILGHLDILPSINIMPAESNHMIGAGLVGLFFTLPLFHFLFRRFRTPIREITVPADYLLLILVIFLALFGDLISWGNSWTASGFILKKADFSVYFQHLASFNFENPRYFLGGPHYHFVVIHVLLANLFFIFVPFSKIVHAFFAMPINLLRRK